MKSHEGSQISSPEKELNKELPESIKEIYVLFHGDPSGEKLSYDAKIRGLAALELARNYPDASINFVGGGVTSEDEMSGSKQLYDYLLKRDEKLENRMKVLGISNNTAGNIEEILSALNSNEDQDQKEGIALISSEYHVSRIKAIMATHNLDASVIPAEKIVRERSDRHKLFIDQYTSSPNYMEKKIIDKIGLLYIKIDPNQKLVEMLRTYRRD